MHYITQIHTHTFTRMHTLQHRICGLSHTLTHTLSSLLFQAGSEDFEESRKGGNEWARGEEEREGSRESFALSAGSKTAHPVCCCLSLFSHDPGGRMLINGHRPKRPVRQIGVRLHLDSPSFS